jgi:predicted AAA+ superfamily ATPase
MKRYAFDDLFVWKNSNRHKPLIINGIRQVDKTWAIREFARQLYKNLVEVNYDETKAFRELFETSKDVDYILNALALASSQKIEPGKTLIFFDEIQECNAA